MNLYALLIGINDYPSRPLTQCVDDAKKMKSYLESIEDLFGHTEIETILNKKATRETIIEKISTFFAPATDDDVVLLYYSGHGSQEQANGLFPEEQDGLLECMVCYSSEDISTAQLIADKELRYLLYKLKSSPHIVTIFDSCHSGDLARAFQMEDDTKRMVRRIAGVFDPREFESFVFAGDDTVVTMAANGSRKIHIPFKNSIHLAACLSEESSWEDDKGGVFTRYLISLLKTTQGNLSYLDIARWAKISIKSVTKMNQTPTITIQGKGKMDAYSSWLNLHPGEVPLPAGMVTNNVKLGWIYSRGSLLGVQKGMKVIITMDHDQEASLTVSEVDLDHAILDVPMDVVKKLDFKKQYAARTELSTYSGLKLYINDIDCDETTVNKINELLSTIQNVQLVPDSEADFYVNVFNSMVYFSLPGHDFQPLAEQILIRDAVFSETAFQTQLQAFIKWQHFYSLDNPGKDYETCPIQVKLTETNGTPVDVTNGTHRLLPMAQANPGGPQTQKVTMEVTNISKETLYVGILTLGSDLGITSNPFKGNVIRLRSGESKTMYDHEESLVYVTLENYKEIYNWKEEWYYYKFIFNNFEDFTPSLNDKDFLQPALEAPRTIDNTMGREMEARGESGKVKEVQKKWGTCRTRIELENTNYNIISGDLKELSDQYASSPDLSPFIQELYFEEYNNGKTIELRLKQNKGQSAAEANRATDNIIVKLLNKIYKTTRRLRFDHQKHRTGPVVVAEGDSWFLFPKPGVRDTLDYIMDKYRLLSLAEAGDEIADYIKNTELLKAVEKEKPGYVLISGGGNDILGSEIKEILKKNVQHGKIATDFIDEQKFRDKLNFLADGYKMFFKEIKSLHADTVILVHGYDYIRSNPDPLTVKKGWANKYMIEAGIIEPEQRKIIISYLVDQFNDLLLSMTQEYSNVHYVNNRNVVHDNEWMDEIHPNNTGFQKVANNFLTLMQ